MMKKILAIMMTVMMAAGGVAPVMALTNPDQACQGSAAVVDPEVRAAAGCEDVDANMDTVSTILRGVLNFVIGFVGVIAVIMIVIAGINMSVSQGDPGKVAKARNAMIYAVIGLVVAILSFAIVNFVLNGVFTG